MKVETKHLKTLRRAHNASPSDDGIVDLYEEMALSVRPKITEAMQKATQLIIDGNSTDEASEILGVSKVAVSQAAVKGLNRLAQFYILLGAKLPEDLTGDFGLPKAKPHLKIFAVAMTFFLNPKQSIDCDF